ncbi:MAG: hypothetical protein KIS77_16225 [Saprospiraceae bacterium]|nr:hypothetical protein [Saprospiraceae bacterium]
MRNKSFLFVLAFLLSSLSVIGQREETLLGTRGWGLSGLWGGVSWDYTQYKNIEATNRRGFFGFEFGRSLQLGWSHFRMIDDILLVPGETQRLDFNYNGGFIGYAFIPYKAIHPTLNVEIGQGRVRHSVEGRDNTLTIQPSAGVEINVFRWFRFGLEGGYRFVNGSNYASITDRDLSGPFGRATLKFGMSWGRYCKKPDYKKNYED